MLRSHTSTAYGVTSVYSMKIILVWVGMIFYFIPFHSVPFRSFSRGVTGDVVDASELFLSFPCV